jgi:hypothetical protein
VTRRVLWSIGVGLAGFLIGGIASGSRGSVLGAVWGASIGYGIGAIFDHRRPTKWLVIHWAATLALIGPLLGVLTAVAVRPYASTVQQTAAGVTGAAVGMVLGFLVGSSKLKRLRRRSQTPHADAVA